MTEGLQLDFHTPPPLTLLPPPHSMPNPCHLPAIREFLPRLLSSGVIRQVFDPVPKFFSRLFIVPKKDGPNRLIIDLSLLNKLLKVPTFKMERVLDIASCILSPMWGCTVDLEDAFYHVPIAWIFHLLLAFVVDGTTYVFQMLPFGLSVAPWAFARVTKPIKAHMHLHLIHFHTYLDDFLLLAPSVPSLQDHTQFLLALLERLGLRVHSQKSHLIPSQRVQYLGVVFHLDTLLLSLPEDKIVSIESQCQSAIRSPSLSRRHLERLVGLLNFAAPFVPLGRLRLRPVVAWMNSHTTASLRDSPVPLDQTLKELLAPWTAPSLLRSPVPMTTPPPSLELMTDASRSGWGATVLPHTISGSWPPSFHSRSINWLELQAVFLSLQGFLDILRDNCVLLMSDNTTVVSCLRKQGSLHSEDLMELTISIMEFCHSHGIRLVPKHLSGSLNVLADLESREGPISTEWSLDKATFQWVSSLSPPFQVDLFATRHNHQLPSFVSPCPDPAALDVNALVVPWSRWDSIYLFPPSQLLHKVSSLILRYQGRGVLIAPFYAPSGFTPNLLLRSPEPIPLPPDHSLSQMTKDGLVFHPDPSVYRLHAWRL